MNTDMLQIRSDETIIGIGKTPFDDRIIICINDNIVKTFIALDNNQIEQLFDNINKIKNK